VRRLVTLTAKRLANLASRFSLTGGTILKSILRSGGRRALGWQLDGFIELAVDELHENLDALQIVVGSKINRALRVLEIKSLVGIGGPIPQALQEQLRSDMLE
jgi:hypothetical protein